MNAHASTMITIEHLRAARAQERVSGRRLVDVLEENSGLAPEDFLRELSALFSYPRMRFDVLDGWSPAFDILPYGEAVARECVLLRNRDGAFALVFSDPFSEVEAWADQRIGWRFDCYLAPRAEVSDLLAGHAEALRAMDGAIPASARDAMPRQAHRELSLPAIQADESPVVRPVQPSLHDVLKPGANDIISTRNWERW